MHAYAVIDKAIPEGVPHICTWMGVTIQRGMEIHKKRSGKRVIFQGRPGSCDRSYDRPGWDVTLVYPAPNAGSKLALLNVRPPRPIYWADGVGYAYAAERDDWPFDEKAGSWEFTGRRWVPIQRTANAP